MARPPPCPCPVSCALLLTAFLVSWLLTSPAAAVQPEASYWRYDGQSDSPGEPALEYVALPKDELLLSRPRRYVSSPISRLADSYGRGLTSASHIKDEILRDGLKPKRAEFIGSVAVAGVPEKGGGAQDIGKSDSHVTPSGYEEHSSPSSVVQAEHEGTTSIPEKQTKKPVDKFPKKGLDGEKEGTADKSNKTKSGTGELDEGGDAEGFPKEITNSTLAKHHITLSKPDNHTYYTSEFYSGKDIANHYWVNLEDEKVIVNEMLSKSHRRAATVRLSFDFPFYGHMVRNMTVATGGFLYTGDYIHSWLAATQYIAPLMANFDTSLSNDSFVKYRDNGTAFTVEWSNVSLQDKKEAGPFTFQVTLHRNGDIVFVYKDIPILVEEIADNQHPVKVGLSDAYIIDKTVYLLRKKTIYEYHRVTFPKDDITNSTVIYMAALPTCVNLTNCDSCLNHNTTFSCKWCSRIGRCSSGFDRYLQEWMNHNCQASAVSDERFCSAETERQVIPPLPSSLEAHSKSDDESDGRLSHSGVVGTFLVLCLLAGLGLFVFHAYKNPHTRFGQMLIKYRPSQWTRFRRGEARYTAATIHM